MMCLVKICRLDCGGEPAMLNPQTGTIDFIYSPLDTPAMASGGVIFYLDYAR